MFKGLYVRVLKGFKSLKGFKGFGVQNLWSGY